MQAVFVVADHSRRWEKLRPPALELQVAGSAASRNYPEPLLPETQCRPRHVVSFRHQHNPVNVLSAEQPGGKQGTFVGRS